MIEDRSHERNEIFAVETSNLGGGGKDVQVHTIVLRYFECSDPSIHQFLLAATSVRLPPPEPGSLVGNSTHTHTPLRIALTASSDPCANVEIFKYLGISPVDHHRYHNHHHSTATVFIFQGLSFDTLKIMSLLLSLFVPFL